MRSVDENVAYVRAAVENMRGADNIPLVAVAALGALADAVETIAKKVDALEDAQAR